MPGRPRIEELAAALDGSRSPLLVAGGGARGATEEIRALGEYGVPVLTTVNGKGILDETHRGALGAGIRLPAAHRALNDADLVIVVGSELGDSDLWGGRSRLQVKAGFVGHHGPGFCVRCQQDVC